MATLQPELNDDDDDDDDDDNNNNNKLCHKYVKCLKLKTIKRNIRVGLNPKAAESDLGGGRRVEKFFWASQKGRTG